MSISVCRRVRDADLLGPKAVFKLPNKENGVERIEGIEAILNYLKAWVAILPDAQATFLSSRRVGDRQE
jgi:hypothetical protein